MQKNMNNGAVNEFEQAAWEYNRRKFLRAGSVSVAGAALSALMSEQANSDDKVGKRVGGQDGVPHFEPCLLYTSDAADE